MNTHFDWEGFLPEHTILIGSKPTLSPDLNHTDLSADFTFIAPPLLEEDASHPEQHLTPGATPMHAPQAGLTPLKALIAATSLADLDARYVQNCKACKLHEKRIQAVFGEGDPNADLVFVGEAPGETEDELGRPFVGKAGALLTKMIEAMGLTRERVYIMNAVKCRPPANREPEPSEVSSCNPYLLEQLRLLQPKIIVALGKHAVQSLLETHENLENLRGKPKMLRLKDGLQVQVMPTFHPEYLLQNPSAKKEVWLDLQWVAKTLQLELPKKGGSTSGESS